MEHCWEKDGRESQVSKPSLSHGAKRRPKTDGRADIEIHPFANSPHPKYKISLEKSEACGALRVNIAPLDPAFLIRTLQNY